MREGVGFEDSLPARAGARLGGLGAAAAAASPLLGLQIECNPTFMKVMPGWGRM